MLRKIAIVFTCFLIICMGFFLKETTHAHPITMISTKVHFTEQQLQAEMLVERDLLLKVGNLSPLTVEHSSQELLTQAKNELDKGFQIYNNGKRMKLELLSHVVDQNHVHVKLTFSSEEKLDQLRFDYGLFFDKVEGHQNIFTLHDQGNTSQFIIKENHRQFDYRIGTVITFWTIIGDFLILGMEHIWFGFDHLAFLMGLLIMGGRFRELLKVITSFTIAHSITLCLAILGIVAASPKWVEALIALSIAYIAIENQMKEPFIRRWIITFYFGLIHGFGFAGSLADTHLPKDHLLTSLFAFNFGVEIGQLVIVVLVVPILWVFSHYRWYPHFQQTASWVIALFGVLWFIERVFEVELPFFPL